MHASHRYLCSRDKLLLSNRYRLNLKFVDGRCKFCDTPIAIAGCSQSKDVFCKQDKNPMQFVTFALRKFILKLQMHAEVVNLCVF